jgi:hypothetical protein
MWRIGPVRGPGDPHAGYKNVADVEAKTGPCRA